MSIIFAVFLFKHAIYQILILEYHTMNDFLGFFLAP